TKYAVDCGVVTVPAHAGSTNGGSVQLAVAVVYSNGAHVAPEPVVFLDGGPGAGSIDVLLDDDIPFDGVLADHDLILFDQRGTGHSTPRPECRLDDFMIVSSAPDGGAPPSADAPDAVAACRMRADQNGLDLSMFRSAENGADTLHVREALGYASWDLY